MDRRIRHCTNIYESQFGFMPGRSTTDAFFILKQTIEKHREGQKNIRVPVTDLAKAYDRIPREVMEMLKGNEMCRKSTLE